MTFFRKWFIYFINLINSASSNLIWNIVQFQWLLILWTAFISIFIYLYNFSFNYLRIINILRLIWIIKLLTKNIWIFNLQIFDRLQYLLISCKFIFNGTSWIIGPWRYVLFIFLDWILWFWLSYFSIASTVYIFVQFLSTFFYLFFQYFNHFLFLLL